MKIIISFLSLLTIGLQAQDITLARTPALSADGNTIAFSYQGDIWTMKMDQNIPQRLTIHEAYESGPVFSPDGKSIAFTGNRYGNNDVFTVPVTGGVPQRLTYHSTNDNVTGWTAENRLIFNTRRTFSQVEWDGEVYSISAGGGTPERMLNAVGKMATMSPDGKKVAFVRGSCRIEREAYKGPADMEIWLYDIGSAKYTQITDNEVNDYLPRWGNDGALYFLSSTGNKYNIKRIRFTENNNKPEAITNYKDEGIRHFDVAGDKVIFERGVDLYIMNTGGKPEKIDLNISTDYRFDPVERKTYTSNISQYEISPSGKYVAMVIHGEVFVKDIDKEKKRSVNLTGHAYYDKEITWLNDSSLLFVSDREGQYDIYLVQSDDPEKPMLFESLKHKIIRLTQTEEDESDLMVSPDGEKLAYQRGNGELVVANINEKGKLSDERTLTRGWAAPGELAWSPDSRYLAYSRTDLTFNREIYIQSINAKSEAVNISMHPRGDYRPVWSNDGSKLGFISARNNGDDDVWFVWLRKEDWLKTKQDREEGYYFADPEPTAEPGAESEDKEDKGEKEKEQKSKPEPIQIDFEDIHDRLVQVTSMPGDERQLEISKDGETFYFTASGTVSNKSDLYKVKFDGSDIEQLTKGGQRPGGIELDPKSDDLYFVKNGVITKVDVKKGSTTTYPHMAQMLIDHKKEREQVFEEAWKILDQRFYDPGFHGQDWAELKKKYKPWAMAASTSQEFRYVFNLMLGQLNASHLGMYGSDPEKTQSQRTGRLGIEVVPVKNGVKVTHVVPNSPGDREKSSFRKGDVILEVGGTPVSAQVNFYELLADQTENRVLMKVKGADGKERELVIRPSQSIGSELYEEWVKERQRLVSKYSNGRLGYIHIRGMNKPSFERFERELMASGMNKEGIVIDVRFNGGGWTTDYLMAVLNVRQHAYTIPRGAAKNLEKEHPNFNKYYPYSERLPLSSWTKPSIAMCNQSSYSNAEIFSHAYKTLDIGTLVGMPTFGAVISTSGTGLLDGSFVRLPFRAWYVKATAENMENGPAVPDILVENDPDDKANGEDTQLKKAVEVLLEEIDENKAGK